MTWREQNCVTITLILRKHGLTVETLSMNYGNGSDNVSREKKADVVQEIWRSVFMSKTNWQDTLIFPRQGFRICWG